MEVSKIGEADESEDYRQQKAKGNITMIFS
jgi:hypothetical protein